jgi:hypothetical protein
VCAATAELAAEELSIVRAVLAAARANEPERAMAPYWDYRQAISPSVSLLPRLIITIQTTIHHKLCDAFGPVCALSAASGVRECRQSPLLSVYGKAERFICAVSDSTSKIQSISGCTHTCNLLVDGITGIGWVLRVKYRRWRPSRRCEVGAS